MNSFFLFLGHRNDSVGIIKNIDILVQPSKFGEGFSRAILEAMSAGKPVIASDVGGNREAIIDGSNGSIISPGDDKALALTIYDLINNQKKRKQMGMFGRKQVEAFFTIGKNVKNTEKVYYQILQASQ